MQPVGQSGSVGCTGHGGIVCILLVEADVVGHCAVEDEGVLRNVADVPLPGSHVAMLQLMTIQVDGACLGLVKAGQQVHQRGLASSRTTDNGHLGKTMQVEVQTAQCQRLFLRIHSCLVSSSLRCRGTDLSRGRSPITVMNLGRLALAALLAGLLALGLGHGIHLRPG